ncbi:MAG: hypothetical protein US39_C0006G0042 [Microgenomates group bacterium GW2011_GWC1_37_12b]|uniref:Inner membrane protein YgaP-like transmembrane domain-containing protein n=1 Tax=Candidatus Woesebacteria bacterium GW2011_GWB1_38_8b TaxID=1618571 RepID=A0A0G0L8T4_9BACT|nr:MAG: hypothetical protein US39_C0006G0042 [Microgenomates group bacterium GW2011_GWC1_37_12b]KKQ87412.1 MAG: hypothetical protein UT10_C0007G0070 [Candidatus Woesebacteria bacterium GW2011_GWB1_38_8b]
MKKNIGTTDRIVRLGIGIILIVSSVLQKSGLSAIFGIFSIYEAVAGWCIFYQILGRNTCPIKYTGSGVPIFKSLLTGFLILFTAIILNLVAGYFGWITWYDLIRNYPEVLSKLNLDNFLFLFVLYPFCLGWVGLIKINI